MAGLKTRENDASVEAFLDSVADDRRCEDCRSIVDMMQRITGAPPKMWGSSIIGFGRYRYQNTMGKDLGWFLTGVAPRKKALTVYIMPGFSGEKMLMERLGPHKTGKSCLYISRLEKIDQTVLEELVARSVETMRSRYHVEG